VEPTRKGPQPLFAAIVCYGMLVTFFVLERALRRGAAAKTLDATPFDRGTTRAIGLAFLSCALSVLVAPLLAHLGLGKFGNPTTAWAGVAAMIFGISLRVWANQTLGASHTRTLKTVEGQSVVSNGPYRVLRHPGYAGVLLMWFGAGVALRNWIAWVPMALVLGWAYRRRMSAEEEMLLTNIGEGYREYRRRTWRIIPFIY
jgi:protein-S-isoprenylcysteine O-methyltransferase Ste14